MTGFILKGSQRAGAKSLATHLLNQYDNEEVEIAEIRGTDATDPHGAFAEIEAIASKTRCKKPFYSLSINPAKPIDHGQYKNIITQVEQRLNLTGQPRAIFYHTKNGRRHAHVVWSRIDIDDMKAIHISHDRLKLKTLSKQLTKEIFQDNELKNVGEFDFNQANKSMNYSEKSQAEETGITPAERRELITKLYNKAENPRGFKNFLLKEGYYLTLGDKRAFVILDRYGEIYSLSRNIEGVSARKIRKFLAPLPLDELPTIQEVQQKLRRRAKIEKQQFESVITSGKQEDMKRLRAIQMERRSVLLQERHDLELTQHYELIALLTSQKTEKKNLFNRMAAKVFSLSLKIPALRSILLPLQELPEIDAEKRHQLEYDALTRRHGRELHIFDRKAKALDLIEAREKSSLEQKYQRQLRIKKRRSKSRSSPTGKGLVKNTAVITENNAALPALKPSNQHRSQPTAQKIKR